MLNFKIGLRMHKLFKFKVVAFTLGHPVYVNRNYPGTLNYIL